MGPHPYIVTVLTDDRAREVQAELTRRQLLAHGVDVPNEQPSPRHPWVVRVSTVLISACGPRKGQTTGAPASLEAV